MSKYEDNIVLLREQCDQGSTLSCQISRDGHPLLRMKCFLLKDWQFSIRLVLTLERMILSCLLHPNFLQPMNYMPQRVAGFCCQRTWNQPQITLGKHPKRVANLVARLTKSNFHLPQTWHIDSRWLHTWSRSYWMWPSSSMRIRPRMVWKLPWIYSR